MYRAAALIGGLAAGNFILVNGTIIAGSILGNSGDDNSLFLILLPIVVGLGLIGAGYRAFRFGEEVEQIEGKVKKAVTTKNRATSWMETITDGGDWQDLMKTGMELIEDVSKKS